MHSDINTEVECGEAAGGASAFRRFISDCIRNDSRAVAADWLQSLDGVVDEELRDIFPSEQYLDHIPLMIDQLAVILDHGDGEPAMANSIISHKALDLGRLRHEQQATISQLLREYDLLANVLEEYMRGWTAKYSGDVGISEVLDVMGVINAIIRLIMNYTVDSFAERYMATIEEQTDKLESFNRLLSHEIRSSLNSALLGIELIGESEGSDELRLDELKRVKHALGQAVNVIDGVDRLVAVKKPTVADNPIVQRLPLKPFLEDLHQQLADIFESKAVTLVVCGELGEACVETGRMKLLLSNLLSNAVKYSDPEKPERKVWVARHNHTDGSMELIVRDNGLGIPVDKLPDVLNMRFRAHSELDQQNGVSGEGLGLFLVDEVIRNMGGSVTLHSVEGEGTSVHLVFPPP